MRCRQHQLVLLAVRRRHYHDEFLDAGDFGRNRVHQHGTGVGGFAAGYVKADAVERRDLLAEPRAIGLAVLPRRQPLPFVVAADTLGGVSQGLTLNRRQGIERGFQCLLRQFQLRHHRHVQPVEAARVVEYRGIAQRAHVGQHLGHGALDGVVGAVVETQQGIERRQEFGIAAREAANRRRGHCTAPAMRSTTGCSSVRFIFKLA